MPDYSVQIDDLIKRSKEASDSALQSQLASIGSSFESQRRALLSQIGAAELQSKKDIEEANEIFDQAATNVQNYDLSRGMIRSTNTGNRYENLEARRGKAIEDINAGLSLNINNINAAIADLKKQEAAYIQQAKWDSANKAVQNEIDLKRFGMTLGAEAASRGGGGASPAPSLTYVETPKPTTAKKTTADNYSQGFDYVQKQKASNAPATSSATSSRNMSGYREPTSVNKSNSVSEIEKMRKNVIDYITGKYGRIGGS